MKLGKTKIAKKGNESVIFTWPLFNLKPEALILPQQISNLFVVNLEIGNSDKELDVVNGLGYVTEDVGEAVWNDTCKNLVKV